MDNIPKRIPDYFSEIFDIPESAIDRNNHVNNVIYVKWIQDISIKHSDSKKANLILEQLSCTWMVHTHHIEYKSQAFLGDTLKVTTWVSEYAKASCKRCCKFERISDGKLVLYSETTWVFIDQKRNRPIAIPEELKNLFCRSN